MKALDWIITTVSVGVFLVFAYHLHKYLDGIATAFNFIAK